MTEEQQLKLQAFFDGELPEKEAREVASWMARDAEAADLHKELRHTRQALADFEPALKVPESREFYWSKIERVLAAAGSGSEAPRSPGLAVLLRRLLVPAGAVVVLAVLLAVAGGQWRGPGLSGGPDTEMTLADAGTFTYQDYAHGTTLVWVSYPAESGFADQGDH